VNGESSSGRRRFNQLESLKKENKIKAKEKRKIFTTKT
jgi:hypothetical protein